MSVQPMVKAEAVHKSFGAAHILKGIDLEVAPREVFCLIGPSGSGKSTFLRCVNHLEQINSGRLWVDGELVGYRQHGDKLYELRDREVAAKRRDIGMVFQRFNLFPHMTAIENVMEGPVQVKRETKAVARELGVNLADVQGTGPGGRIIRADVEAAAEQQQAAQPAAPQPAQPRHGHQGVAQAQRADDQDGADLPCAVQRGAHRPLRATTARWRR